MLKASPRKVLVILRVYDISSGAAKAFAPMLLGRTLEGVWHSGIEVYGYEYFYGGGIVKMRPENVETCFGISPSRTHQLGYTDMSRAQFEAHLQSVSPMFTKDVYDLVNWNCNHFTDHMAWHLVGRGIPDYILDLPKEINRTFMGRIVVNFIKMLSGGAAPVGYDNPDHPSKLLNQSTLPDARKRRNSCPASPTHHQTTILELPKSKRPTHVDPPRVAVVDSKRRTRRGATLAPSKSMCRESSDEHRSGPLTEQLLRIPGAKIGDSPTELVLSPKHKRLYEAERDNYVHNRARRSRHRIVVGEARRREQSEGRGSATALHV